MKGVAHFNPWSDDPDPPDYWEAEDYADMRSRLRKYWAAHLRDDWDEQLHPRDEIGRFAFANAGETAKITGLPDGANLHDRLIGQALERKAFTSTAREVVASRYESGRRFEVVTTAKIPDTGVERFEMRPATGKVAYYNPTLADLTTTDKGVEYIERTSARPKAGLATEITPLPGEGIMYRGMRAEEYAEFLKTGEVVSTGKYNMSGQEGLTYWADHPSTAESYANSFAPWPHKATFERPAFVVAARIPPEVKKVEGTGENEIGVSRAMKKDEIVGVWRGDVYQHTPGVADFREVAENDFSFSGGVAPSSQLVWSRIDEAKSAIKLTGGTTKERVKAAIEEAYGELHPNPMAERQVGFGNEAGTGVVMMELENYSESLYVKWLSAFPHKGGMGTRGMDYLKQLATKHNVPLTLTPWKTGELGEKKLTRIFKKWGYKPGKQGLMWWHPMVHDRRPWDESKFERGQPENKGQFASKGAAGGGSAAPQRPSAAAVLAAAKSPRPMSRFTKAAHLAGAGKIPAAKEMIRGEGERARARNEAAEMAARPPVEPASTGKPQKEDFDKAGIRLRVLGGGGGRDETKAEAEAVDRWNATVKMSPAEFKKTFLGGMPGTMIIEADPKQAKYTVKGQILGEDDLRGVYVASYDRTVHVDQKSAYSALFEVSESAQKRGIGKKLLAGNIAAYEKMGFNEVRVTAGLTVGGYAWAKYGYVPNAEDWETLRHILKSKIEGGGSRYSGNRGTDTMEASSWEEIDPEQQDQVRSRWRTDSYEEFLQSEIDNWRDGDDPMREARRRTAEEFNGGGVMDMPLYAEEAFDELIAARRDEGLPEFPYSDRQLYAAMELVSDDNTDGGDLSLKWDEDKLNTYVPPGHAPGQLTLPGVEEVKPANYMTPDLREEIGAAILKAAESKADDESINVDPPSYLAESVNEYMSEYWDTMDDDQLYDIATRYDLHNIPIEDEDEEPDEDFDEARAAAAQDPVMQALNDPNPKAIWRVADSARGKELLLRQGWTGVLNLKDPETMARFKEYVGRAKKNAES